MATQSDVLYKAGPKPKRKTKTIYKRKPDTKEEEGINGSSKIDSFQQQALEIREPGPDFDPSTIPQDGDEYLMHMLYERKQCPAVMVNVPIKSNNGTTAPAEKFKDEQEPLRSVSNGIKRPTKEWKAFQLSDFEATCEKIVLMRLELHRQRYDQKMEPPLITESNAWKEFCQKNPPLLKIILRFSQRTLQLLLEFICDWMRKGEEAEILQRVTEDPIPSTSNAASGGHLNSSALDLLERDAWIGTWLYATLCCLHIPVEPDVHSTLRDIARVCIRLRGRLPTIEAEKAVPYNLFILLISESFGQMDFAEFV